MNRSCMKFTLGLLLLAAVQSMALQAGSIAFVGLDGEGTDGFAFVAVEEIPAQTTLYFCDAPWDGASFGTKEGDFSWSSGVAAVAAGTVVKIDMSSATSYVANVGAVTIGKEGGLGKEGENLFAYTGTAARSPQTFLAAIATDPAMFSTLYGTGLTLGSTAIVLPTSNVASYTGARTGLDPQGLLAALNNPVNWTLTGLTDLATPVNFSIAAASSTPVVPEIEFQDSYSVAPDNAGTHTIALTLSEATTVPVSVDVRLVPFGTATTGTHIEFSPIRIALAAGATGASVSVPVKTVAASKQDVYFAVELISPAGVVLGTEKQHLAYVRKNQIQAPAAANALGMKWLHSFKTEGTGTAEIVAYSAAKKRLYVLNSTAKRVDILDFSNPAAIAQLSSLDMSAYGVGATSVAVHGDWVAATIDAGPSANGKVVFLDLDGKELKVLEVGNLPDMVTFTPDGKWLLTANEGQPSDDYSVDPEGSITLIDLSGGDVGALTSAQVHTVGFADFNSQKTTLQAAGVRVFGVYPGGSSVAQDLEPEYITVASDSKTAWITLQENNAIAVLDLEQKKITSLMPLGFKDHSQPGNEFDASDKTSSILLANWPVYGLYMPDAIANYSVGGQSYVVTANEGDARDYAALKEEKSVADLNLDPNVFPQAALLQTSASLGRLTAVGCAGAFESPVKKICAMGGRSFSIWNATTGQKVYDSGSDLERITATDLTYGALFNSAHDKNSKKNRSDNKGPEPEGVALGVIDGKTYAFMTLERVGGVLVYNVSDPAAPVFEGYANSRDVAALGGDLGPEGVIFIDADSSPSGKALVVAANEISASISVFELANTQVTPPVTPPTTPPESETFLVRSGDQAALGWNYRDDVLHLEQASALRLYSLEGVLLESHAQTDVLSLKQREAGFYWVRFADGRSLCLLRIEP